MAVFKCKMCGGSIEFEKGASVGVCDSCGTQQTLPRIDDDKKANMYDRANHFRRNNDYDKAMNIYEQILNEDNSDAEAYWSLVLCRYGIEYVEDPSSHKRVPTVNRAQFTSIYMDEDYKSALKYADSYQRTIYESEAKAIDDIQKGILEISSKEEPFDVFICYKETDATGRRTQDSVLANDLYHQLTQEGFKVFFSRITLEDKLGVAYEPYIFAALNSAKVMVVIGTKPEYFNAVWVKNEWSRYLALVKNSNGKKMLIPAYKDMDPYDLPEEFSHLQAQDMAKLGFMQDLIRGIKKITAVDTPKATTVVKENVVTNNNSNTAPLLKRAFMFLEDGKWTEANEYCEKVLDQDPENAEAYLGKLMAELQVKKKDNLKNAQQPFDNLDNCIKASRFDSAVADKLKKDNQFIRDRNETARKQGIYDYALDTMSSANTEKEYLKAALLFRSTITFNQAKELEKTCREKAEICRKDAIYDIAVSLKSHGRISDLADAIEEFKKIPDYKDSNEQIDACNSQIEKLKKQEEARRKAEREKQEAAAKKKKKIIKIGTPMAAALIAFIIVLNTVILPASKYKKAIKLMDSGDYESAYTLLTELDYKDSADQAHSCLTQIYGNTKVGDYITFGSYGKEDIEWLVLDKQDNKLLVISKYALDTVQYHTNAEGVTWATSTIRTWLNGTFYKAAFNSSEQGMIKSTKVTADANPSYNTDPGNDTTDNVFLLSINEVNKYFSSDEARKCVPTEYAINKGAWTSSDYTVDGKATCCWWLRSPGAVSNYAAYVTYDGDVFCRGFYVDDDDYCVRPALWIEI
jgi:tetratricopeptide (TPR) repeat protein